MIRQDLETGHLGHLQRMQADIKQLSNVGALASMKGKIKKTLCSL
jgi:hypothetical protein